MTYSDGSKSQDGFAGSGWSVWQGGMSAAEGNLHLGQGAEVFDAEAQAAKGAAAAAVRLQADRIVVCLDNRSVVDRLNATHPRWGSSQEHIDATRRLLHEWHCRAQGRTWEVRWIPGHKEIRGNERADVLAKAAAADRPARAPSEWSLAALMRWRRNALASDFRSWWREARGRREYEDPAPWRALAGKLPRKAVGRVLAARSGHGDFDAYHTQLNHDTPLGCPRCRQEKSVTHAWTCRSLFRPWSDRFVLKMLKTNRGAAALAKRISAT